MHENRCDQIVNILLMSYIDIVFFASGKINCSPNLKSNKSKISIHSFHTLLQLMMRNKNNINTSIKQDVIYENKANAIPCRRGGSERPIKSQS